MKVVSWFSGIGGFDVALIAAGHEIVGACEIDRQAREVYSARLSAPAWFPCDIRKINSADIPDADLWCGGFPCQDVSLAGRRAGAGEGTRTGLWWTWHRLMVARHPAVVLAENVPGLLSSRDGADFGAILVSLVSIGYRVVWTVLDARYFGVAQRRRRVFILASLVGDPRTVIFDGPESAPMDLEPPHAVLIDDRWESLQTSLLSGGDAPFGGASWPTSGYAHDGRCWTRDVLEWRGFQPQRSAALIDTLERGAIPERFYLSPRACAGILRRANRRGRILPAALEAALLGEPTEIGVFGGNRTSGPREQAAALSAHGRLDFETERLLIEGDIASTIRAADGRHGWSGRGDGSDNLVAVGASKVRRLTPTECERLMGFLDGYTCLCGVEPYTTATCRCASGPRYGVLGNSVVVPVVEWIGHRLRRAGVREAGLTIETIPEGVDA